MLANPFFSVFFSDISLSLRCYARVSKIKNLIQEVIIQISSIVTGD